jgi:hypothetical protein
MFFSPLMVPTKNFLWSKFFYFPISNSVPINWNFLKVELELFKKHQFHFLVFCKNLSITECEKLKSDYQSDSVNVKSDSVNVKSDSVNVKSDSVNVKSNSVNVIILLFLIKWRFFSKF